jgi:homoserine dehydrogenase
LRAAYRMAELTAWAVLGVARSSEMKDVEIESLIPEALRDVTREAFLDALPDSDASWAAAVDDARANNSVVRYRVRITRAGVRAGLARVTVGSPLASLDGTDNLFVFMTKRYRQRPLVVSGPGAGAVVTAAGVLGDVLRIVSA